jgi:hypothetical protein
MVIEFYFYFFLHPKLGDTLKPKVNKIFNENATPKKKAL